MVIEPQIQGGKELFDKLWDIVFAGCQRDLSIGTERILFQIKVWNKEVGACNKNYL